MRYLLAAVALIASIIPSAQPPPAPPAAPVMPRIAWRHSVAVGKPWAGRLVRGVQLPARGPGWRTWDPGLKRSPDRPWRRWGTDRLVRLVLRAVDAYHREHPEAPAVLVGDLSRTHGGNFGPQYGGLGHSTHQNGRDVDVYYPRRDGRLTPARRVHQVDQAQAQALLRSFLAAGAKTVLIGPRTGLHGPSRRVKPWPNHDDHLHVRIGPVR